jgi:uncharacterized protein
MGQSIRRARSTGSDTTPGALRLHPHEQLVRRFCETRARFNTAERGDQITAPRAPDIAWHVPGRTPIAGEYRGKEAVLDYFASRGDTDQRSSQVAIQRLLADHEFVTVLAGGQAKIGGTVREWKTLGIHWIVANRIAECWLLPFDQGAFDEIWS